MSVKVRIPAQLRQLTGDARELVAAPGAVREIIAALEASHPGIKDRLLDGDGKQRRFVAFFVDDEDVRFLEGIDTPVKDGETLSIVPAVAGG